MRKATILIAGLFFCIVTVRAQAPSFFNYQGVARNPVGNALVNKAIRLRLTVLDGSALGLPLYSETRQVTTNAFGLFNVQVGSPGANSSTGSMQAVTWQTGTKWLRVEIDVDGGTQFKEIATTQLSSVPFSLFSNQSNDMVLPFVKTQQDANPLLQLTNSGNAMNSLVLEATSASTANNSAAIRGILSSVSPGVSSAAVIGQNNGTGANGSGVFGQHAGGGNGVYGMSFSGSGLSGISTSGAGVFGQSSSGAAVFGFQPNTGTGPAGRFQSVSTTNNAATLLVESSGTGTAAGIITSGTGRAGLFTVNNTANGSTALEVVTNGTGRTGLFQNSNAANASPNLASVTNGAGDGFLSQMNGSGKAGVFVINNPANNRNALEVVTNGTGRSALFQNSNAANTSPNLASVSNGAGDGMLSLMNGSGKAGVFIINNAASSNVALEASSNGSNTVMQSVSTGTGRAGSFTVSNPASTVPALDVNTSGTGYAANIVSTNVSPRALRTSGAVQFTGLGEGPGKVFATVDGSGTASWQNASSVGLVSGSGTSNFLPRWTPDGTTLGNSQIQDNGSQLGLGGAPNTAYKVNVEGRLRVSGSDPGAIALIENTSSDANSDGLVIKLGRTHPRWNGSAYANVPNPSTQGVQTQVDQIRDWIYGNDTFSWTDLINLMPSQYVTGTMCNITNYVTGQINSALGLPRGTPAVDVGYEILNALNNFSDPLINDNWVNDIRGAIVIPAFQLPSIPSLNCTGLPTLSFPVFQFTNVNNTLSKENEFVAFVDKDNRKLGSIRAQSIENFSYDYFDGQKLLDLAAEFIGIDIVDDFMSIISGISEMVNDYNAIGVEYSSGNGDYAEWLERANPDEEISYGDIVGVKGGKITRDIRGAEQVMAVSKKPIVLGNVPADERVSLGNNVAFMGQIPVKVMGPVQSGDYIVAKADVPGYGVAVNPRNMTVEDFKLAVGRSWDTHEKPGPKMVNTVIGVHNHDFLHIIGDLQQKARQTDERLKALETLLQSGDAAPRKEPAKKAFK